MRLWCLWGALFSLFSCQYFERNLPDEKLLLEKRLREIDWKQPTAYPVWPGCDSLSAKDAQKNCFTELLSQWVQERFASDSILMQLQSPDTLQLQVRVLPGGDMQFQVRFDDTAAYDTNYVDSVIRARLSQAPKVEPGHKEGIPITTEVHIPVVLKVNP